MTKAFYFSLACFLAALVVAVANLFSNKRRLVLLSTRLRVVGTSALTVYLIMRWVEAGRAPFSNMYESLVLFAWSIMVIYLVLQIRINLPAMSVATTGFAALTLAYAKLMYPDEIQPLMPALQSRWLAFHVFTCFMGYGGFAIAFLSSIGYLVTTRQGSRSKPETVDSVDAVTAATISFGFLFLTLGIITGAVWANSAWGTYWQWDPKETWSLITWFVYAVFLHCRYMRGWKGKRAAYVSIFGFASVLFTYFGVNYVLSGLHSYAN